MSPHVREINLKRRQFTKPYCQSCVGTGHGQIAFFVLTGVELRNLDYLFKYQSLAPALGWSATKG